MRTELPVCKRCCFCVPLRYGLITWGYFKLIVSAMVSIPLSINLYIFGEEVIRYHLSISAINFAIVCVVLLIVLTDVAFNTLFIVGGHTKNLKLLRVNYIYNIVTLCLTIALVLVMVFLIVAPVFPNRVVSYNTWALLLDFSTLFVNIIMQIYFLLLLRSEIIKLRNNCEFRFVNNAVEAECVMKYKEGMVDEEKGTKDVCEEGPCGSEDECWNTCLINETCHKNEDQN